MCRKAADIASEFSPDNRFIEKRSAFVYAATAIANSGDLNNAIPYAKKAVAVVSLGHDDNSGSSAAYSVLGELEALTGNFADGDHDLTTSEDYERKGIVWAETNAASLAPSYRGTLAKDLRFHAELLKHLNRPEDAQAKLDEANKLSPSVQ
ncbi:hypothetical protein ACFPT7_18845 [Acidicapsa dinghuensis]|uniref:Tetratricopeptide repeat protein n=1 Tax=Acidicapsa dinghuensis TaxID=2218256 RepID=A0ABW1EJA2_9BACT|nr:hypothetical protein [Acidicapsa dinghuensis]